MKRHHGRIRAGHPRERRRPQPRYRGTRVLSDRIVIRSLPRKATRSGRMIALVEGRAARKPERNRADDLLAALTLIFLLVCVTLKPFGITPPRCSPFRCHRALICLRPASVATRQSELME